MTVKISRGIEGLWLIIEHDCAIEHVRIFYHNEMGYYVTTDTGNMILGKDGSLKSLWKYRRKIATEVIRDLYN